MKDSILKQIKDLGFTLSHHEECEEGHCFKFKHPKLENLLEAVVLATSPRRFSVFVSLPCKTGFLPVSRVSLADERSIMREIRFLVEDAQYFVEEINKFFLQPLENLSFLRQREVDALKILVDKLYMEGLRDASHIKTAKSSKDTIYQNLINMYQSLIKGEAVVRYPQASDTTLSPITNVYDQITLGEWLYAKFRAAHRRKLNRRAAAQQLNG
jgi:hypothetical protein